MEKMDSISSRQFFTLFALVAWLFSASIFAGEYSVAEAEKWIKPLQIPKIDTTNSDKQANGVEYMLADYQTKAGSDVQKKYRHFAFRALNTSGVSEVAGFSIDFDPLFESVKLHKIVIHRDGHALDMIQRAQLSVIQREKELEYQIYDGTKTLNAFLEDVRVGDIVEYSYTLDGANPIFKGHYSDYFQMQWVVPLGRAHYRLIWEGKGELYHLNHIISNSPKITEHQQFKEYVWDLYSTKKRVLDKDVPNWFAVYPGVYVSDYNSWINVVDWALPLYSMQDNTPRMDAVISAISKSIKETEGRVLGALRFVQDDIRYLGIEMGVRSHKPNTPDKVLEQRFGDCKDKALLLVSLLRNLGIEANPALVHTTNKYSIKDQLPTPRAFNHVIVQVQIDGKRYWLDPTRNYQRGNLKSLFQPDYGYALIISKDSAYLTRMLESVEHTNVKYAEEIFDLRDEPGMPASYKVFSRYERYYADSMRRELAERGLDELQNEYLNYTARTYPKAKFISDLKVTDNTSMNKLAVMENYQIEEIWEESEDGRYLNIGFWPYLIKDQINRVASPVRTMPYAITHPVKFHHTTRILISEDSEFEQESHVIDDESFEFQKNVDFNNGELLITYTYTSLKDHVLPSRMDEYTQNIEKLIDLSSYQIVRPNPKLTSGANKYSWDDMNWQLLGITLVCVIVFIILVKKYINDYDPEYIEKGVIYKEYEGLSGWMILPLLGLFLTPVRLLIDMRDSISVFSKNQWSLLEDQFAGSGLLNLIAVELILNLGLVVLTVGIIILCVQKRHTFPKLYIVYFMINLVVYWADLLVISLLFNDLVPIEGKDITEGIKLILNVAFWGTYFVVSKRARATFTRRKACNASSPQHVDKIEPAHA